MVKIDSWTSEDSHFIRKKCCHAERRSIFNVFETKFQQFQVPCQLSGWHQTKNIWMQPPRDPKDWRVTLTLQPTQQKDQETLVGGFEPWILYVFHILGMSSSQLTNSIIFQRGSTTNQNWCFYRVQAHRIHGHCLRSNPRVTSSYPSRTSFQARLDP